MEFYALYLPQFHAIKENDLWWGKGFTEWNNVKKGTPLFKGHDQPQIPLGDNYYNLLNRETVIWQTNLMHRYGIDGMIYYHYYFNGKLLLEKPAENLLKWQDIDQPFFFNWANHTWNRAWKGSREILLEQTYGKREDWKKHFDYLLPFFKDARYIKKDNKPLFMIYDVNFDEKNEMFDYFNTWCIENGFDGLYLIEEIYSFEPNSIGVARQKKASCTEKLYITEPFCGKTYVKSQRSRLERYYQIIRHKLIQKGLVKYVETLDGDKIYQAMLKKELMDEDIVHGVFFAWDNTPRHGTRGHIITPVTKQTFYRYLTKIKNSQFVVINAWNEWAEGMMLEPTVSNGYRYLEWIKEWKDQNEGTCK